jgi:hypothetical protein
MSKFDILDAEIDIRWWKLAHDLGCTRRGCLLAQEYDRNCRGLRVTHQTPNDVQSEVLHLDRDTYLAGGYERAVVRQVRDDHERDEARSSWVGRMLDELTQ